jgi:hypothetical protein
MVPVLFILAVMAAAAPGVTAVDADAQKTTRDAVGAPPRLA